MYEKLNRYYDGGDKLWSDFESELPNLNKDVLFDWATTNNPNWNQNWDGYYSFIDEVLIFILFSFKCKPFFINITIITIRIRRSLLYFYH